MNMNTSNPILPSEKRPKRDVFGLQGVLGLHPFRVDRGRLAPLFAPVV
jgi:hypothetical protein